MPTLSFSESLEYTQDLLAKTVYGQQNILKPESVFYEDPRNELFKITNFYRNSGKLDQGTCSELSEALFKNIQSSREVSFSKVGTVLRCSGKDGGRNGVKGYFSAPGASHQFLIYSPEKNIVDSSKVVDTDSIKNNDISRLLSNSYVVDPSFKIIKPYEDSGYLVDRIKGELVVVPEVKDIVFFKDLDKYPVFQSEDGTIWCLSYLGQQLGLCLCKKSLDEKSWIPYVLKFEDPEIGGFMNKSKIMYWNVKELRKKVKATQKKSIDPMEMLEGIDLK
jgi:hypothetical protein